MNIPTAHSSDSLERFIEHIANNSPAEQINRQYLDKHGFTSGNDPELRHIGRLLGFLDDQDMPLPLWEEYRQGGQEVLKAAIENCYKELFSTYEEPYLESDDALALWFKPPVTGKTSSSRERAIRTFRKLCVLAGYDTTKPATKRTQKLEAVEVELGLQSHSGAIVQLPPGMTYANYQDMFQAYKDVYGKDGA